MQNSQAQPKFDTHGRTLARQRRWFSFIILTAAFVGFLVTVLINGRVLAQLPLLSSKTEANFSAQATSGIDYSKFSHASSRHASLACASCHRRSENNASVPNLPGHKACTDCHLAQFVTPNIPMCAICHTDLKSPHPPVKNFPNLQSFNAKFDHAQHMSGAARPDAGCTACHSSVRRGVAMSIPVGFNAHTRCYTCHTPGAQSGGREISSCGVCHSLARYSRTSGSARSFSIGFRHSDHGPRQRLNCADCHSVKGGLAQARQVSAPRGIFHAASIRAQNCMTCHNGRRAFGDTDFNDCKRCHKGQTFTVRL